MWRYLVGAAGALVLALAGMFMFRSVAATEAKTAPPPAPAASVVNGAEDPLPAEAPRAADKTREQKRFDRVDKDKNAAITREEYLATRRKAFARLDKDGDGRLSFDEWAVKTTTRFAEADKDRSGSLTRAEFATTAPKRRAAQPRCACPKPTATPAADDENDDISS
ncbi:EF-hand domain-containing protein [Sphingomonas sp. HF-S3]|uniref:EF-hand domain-containing protein n=1 Tax=Sphingomonas rustica TaxID=3103142 RepID=A0ABV0BBE5_9SPHN